MDSQIGSIETGKKADIIASSENPLENIDALLKIRFVMKGGELIKGPI
jgi:imidazolonepropionase-like amidohydrolase